MPVCYRSAVDPRRKFLYLEKTPASNLWLNFHSSGAEIPTSTQAHIRRRGENLANQPGGHPPPSHPWHIQDESKIYTSFGLRYAAARLTLPHSRVQTTAWGLCCLVGQQVSAAPTTCFYTLWVLTIRLRLNLSLARMPRCYFSPDSLVPGFPPQVLMEVSLCYIFDFPDYKN